MLKEKNALIVDDEQGIREILRDELEKHGAFVEEAGDGTEALLKIRARAFDFVISDIRMTQGSGIKLVEELFLMPPPKPAIFLCTAFPDLTLEQAKAKGVIDIFPKPFILTHVVNRLLQHLRT